MKEETSYLPSASLEDVGWLNPVAGKSILDETESGPQRHQNGAICVDDHRFLHGRLDGCGGELMQRQRINVDLRMRRCAWECPGRRLLRLQVSSEDTLYL